ncbi:MAG: MotA/TolQ/ExbB proton channel family protein [Myxococcota bacterium]|nr:MotA/TolQ/ExbB proton channel family protein [Myxococcota bacterium]
MSVLFEVPSALGVALLLIALGGAALVIERLLALYWVGWRSVEPLLNAVEGCIAVGDRQGAMELCAAKPWVHLSWLGACALSAPDAWSGEALSEATTKLLRDFGRRAELLGVLANLALLLGLLGSVCGLAQSLGAIAFYSPEWRSATSPAMGVADAVYSTWLGLCIALPLLIVRGLFREREATLRARILHTESRLRGML